MPLPKKSDWPKTTDGTTDWESLFENPKKGLIAVITATQTPEQLRLQTDAIIHAVFSRKRDQALMANLAAYLDKLIPDNADPQRLPTMQVGVRQVLVKIKGNRIKRAAASVTKKKNKGSRKAAEKNDNRRAGRFWGRCRRCADAFAIFMGLLMPGKAKSAAKTAKRSNKAAQTSEEEGYFQQEAYVDHGGGDTEWEDDDMHAMKEGQSSQPSPFDDGHEEQKGGDKYESWDDY